METKQKNRENVRSPEAAREERFVPRQEAAPPSGVPHSGAAKSADARRSSAAQTKPTRQRDSRPQENAPRKKVPAKAAGGKSLGKGSAKAPPKRTATKKTPPARKRPTAKQDPDDISARRRAYGRSKPPKKTVVTRLIDSLQKKQTARKNKKSSANKQPTPAVIYTQPQAFNRTRLLVQLLTAAGIVAALILGLSVFFKVKVIEVTGAEVYSEWMIREASGLEDGDNLLTFSHARSAALIKANLPYVDTVRFGIKLPDTVNIIVKEDDVVYGIKDQNGQWWLMNSDGRIVEMGDAAKASNHTQVLGVVLDNPVVDERAVAMETVSAQTLPEGETAPIVTTTGAQRLTAALQILRALEQNDIVGEAASVDVTRMEDIILWYGSRYQVNLGDSTRLDYKVACMNDVILQMSDYQSGILDISFTIWPTQVGYTPFA